MRKSDSDEILLDLGEIFAVIKKRLWIIILITILAVGTSLALSLYVMPPVYEAECSIIIGSEHQDDYESGNTYSYNDVMMYEKMLKTYSEIAKSKLVTKLATRKLKELGQEDLSLEENSFTVNPYEDTQILKIKAKDTDPHDAMIKANVIAQTFVEEANRIYPSGNVQVLDEATLPVSPVSPKTRLNMAVAFILGIIISLGIIFITEYMDNTLKTEEDIKKYVDVPIIGLIPKETKAFH